MGGELFPGLILEQPEAQGFGMLWAESFEGPFDVGARAGSLVLLLDCDRKVLTALDLTSDVDRIAESLRSGPDGATGTPPRLPMRTTGNSSRPPDKSQPEPLRLRQRSPNAAKGHCDTAEARAATGSAPAHHGCRLARVRTEPARRRDSSRSSGGDDNRFVLGRKASSSASIDPCKGSGALPSPRKERSNMHKLGLCSALGAAVWSAVLSLSIPVVAEPAGPGIGTSPGGERREVQPRTGGDGSGCSIVRATGGSATGSGAGALLAAAAVALRRRRPRTQA
jgi:MYXO-CTERM domain-containing protein